MFFNCMAPDRYLLHRLIFRMSSRPEKAICNLYWHTWSGQLLSLQGQIEVSRIDIHQFSSAGHTLRMYFTGAARKHVNTKSIDRFIMPMLLQPERL
jgi:hypothetical protein